MKYHLSKDQISVGLEDGQTILQTKDGLYFELNEVGKLIWDALKKQPLDDFEIIQLVSTNYEVDNEVVKRDVETLIGDLLHHNLIEKK